MCKCINVPSCSRRPGQGRLSMVARSGHIPGPHFTTCSSSSNSSFIETGMGFLGMSGHMILDMKMSENPR